MARTVDAEVVGVADPWPPLEFSRRIASRVGVSTRTQALDLANTALSQALLWGAETGACAPGKSMWSRYVTH